MHRVKAGLTHGARLGSSRAPSVLAGASLAPLSSVLCTLCRALLLAGWYEATLGS